MVFISLDVVILIIITFVTFIYALPTNVVDSHIENRYDIMSVFKIIVDLLNHLYFKFVIAKTRYLSFVATNYMSKT